jgi:ferredoxin
MGETRVWIDQDLCTGDGLCEEICPSLFGHADDGLYYVKEAGWKDIFNGGSEPVYKMSEGTALVPDEELEACIEAADECPGSCIFLDYTE